MVIYPAIDLYEGKAVRLLKGDYDKMTVYSERPWEIAADFARAGASHIHVVDLEGARDGSTPNLETVLKIKAASKTGSASAEPGAADATSASGSSCRAGDASEPAAGDVTSAAEPAASTGMFVEIGGGIRNMETVSRYLDAGIDRVILGTAAVKDPEFLREAVERYGKRIAVGIDVRDGYVAIKGWLELTEYTLKDFALKMQDEGVSTIICTDISRDGAMKGTNREMYRELSEQLDIDIVASGGVSSMEDVRELAALGIHGAIIGRAYYNGAIDLREAVRLIQDASRAGGILISPIRER